MAPDVVLEADHILPRCEGGKDELTNLVTSCVDCNRGKGGRKLSDDTVIKKQQRQLALLNERREQIEMVFRWKRELDNLDEMVCDEAAKEWNKHLGNRCLTDSGKRTLGTWIRKFGLIEVLDAMKIAADTYLSPTGENDSERAEHAFDKIAGICVVRRRSQDDPNIALVYRILATLRNRLDYINVPAFWQLTKRARALGVDLDSVQNVSNNCSCWSGFRDSLQTYIDSAEGDDHGEN